MDFCTGRFLIRYFLLAVLTLISIRSSAQRTTAGQGMLSLEGSYPHGAGIAYGQYLSSSMWEAGASVLWRQTEVSEDYTMSYMPLLACGYWMYRLCGTRSRSLSLYLGPGIFLGWEIYEPWGDLPDYVSSDLTGGTFLYGVGAKLQAELFVSRTVALLFTGSVPVNFTSPCTWIQPSAGIGVRMNL